MTSKGGGAIAVVGYLVVEEKRGVRVEVVLPQFLAYIERREREFHIAHPILLR